MRKIIFMLLLAVVSGSAAAEWVKVGRSEMPTNYADTATIRRTGNMVRMWSLSDFKSIQTGAGKSYMSVKTQIEYDCKKEQARTLVISAHAGNMGAGKTVSIDSDPAKWQPIPPESALERLWQMACGKK